MQEKAKNILIDTDIGGDVDDALALALALNTPEKINVVAITLVYLANEWRANVTRNILKVFEREDIPVCLGAEKPLIGWWDESRIPNSAKDFGVIEGKPLPPACDYIIEMAEKYEELTIAAIGPLTNVGLAIAKAPYIINKINIVMMGGHIKKANPEWNIVCDPEAARIVFESGVKIRMVGLDVTNRCQFSREDIDYVKAAGNQRADMLGEMMDTFCEKFGYLPILHDPLAVADFIWDDIMTFEEKMILVETAGQYTRGVTVDSIKGFGNKVFVATDVEPMEFKKRLLEKLIM